MTKVKPPPLVTVTPEQLESLLQEARRGLPAPTYQLLETLLQMLQWLMLVIQHKHASIKRLHRMIFGAKTESTQKLFPPSEAAHPTDATAQAQRKGHGRHGADAYVGARRIPVAHPELQPGSLCPKCLKGLLYRLKRPAQLVCLIAQPLFQATVYELDKLRCALCGAVFTAPPPPPALQGKHDESVGIMLAIMRYGAGLPLYRMDKWQRFFGVPLPASTQWELIVRVSEVPTQMYETLIGIAAQGQLFYNDDTPMRVQSLRQQIEANPDPNQRRGIFTTSIIAEVGEQRIALFFTGPKHAGENLGRVLQQRAADLAKPLLMCDGLSRNEPTDFDLILSHCLTHGRRNFIDVAEDFPEECRHVVESLRAVYGFEAAAQQDQLTPPQRLLYHQTHSQPIMVELKQWMQEQLDQKRVEPNSGLGESIRYMLKHWEALTQFLRLPGAPLDNNITERALKMAILHRKNSLSYKTLEGARVGDIFMSLLHTCQLNRVNPFEYLMALLKHAQEVIASPKQWLPWNYPQATVAENTG